MITTQQVRLQVPYFRPSITEAEIDEVTACLRSGWLTTGPKAKRFEEQFAASVGAAHAIAVNSCTAALHLAVEAMRLRRGQAVLVPTMTFAATAEVVRYQGAIPLLVDCDPVTLNMDLEDAARKVAELRTGRLLAGCRSKVVGIMPVHVGGLMMDVTAIQEFATRYGLWIVEDAAHALPAAMQTPQRIIRCGEDTADVTCFSFYTNKTITTGEGGMAVTADAHLARRMRRMSLHGLSADAWNRYSGGGRWDYRIVAAGYKYNMTDIAASLGLHQLARAEAMRCEREAVAAYYRSALDDLPQIALPPAPENRLHAWHLFPLRLQLDKLACDRDTFLQALRQQGVGCSVHWRPLHRHPYYRKHFGWRAKHLPVATAVWKQLISLPLFPGMRREEQEHVVQVVRHLCSVYAAETVGAPVRTKPR